MSARSFKVVLQFDEESASWVSFVPDLDYISTFGESEQDALDNTRELILGYLEASAKEGLEITLPKSDVRLVDLEVAQA